MSTAVSQPEFPRRLVAAEADLGHWPTAEHYYRELAERPLDSAEQYEQWLLDFSEVESIFGEEGTARYIAMTRQTDDPQREARFLDFIENVKPLREPWSDRLRRKADQAARKFALPRKRYEVLERSIRNSIELYREENIALKTENEVLSQQYQKITASMTAQFDGREQTLQQLDRYLEEPDRALREKTWRLGAERVLADREAIDALYDKMVAVRHRIAQNAGCRDFREYAFKELERFDYTPEDCLAFHDAIEAVVLPAVRELANERRRKLGLSQLRPWDNAVDTDSRPPLRPFETDERLIQGCSRIFHRISGELGEQFDRLHREDLLDLGSRKGKAPGGYQANYEARRLPFIFMNAVGTERDVRTLLHEAGHAFHSWASRQDPLLPYRGCPTEFAEVGSMGMECLALPYLDEFYGTDAPRARKRFFTEMISFFPWMACVDGFQHYVYTNVDHDIERRKDEWVKIWRRFARETDWSGLELEQRHLWHRKLHFFEVPFYYVEYGIAQIGALQVWLNSRRDYAQAVAFYRNGLALGGSRPLPELFEAAGCKFDFSAATLRPLIEAVMEEIQSLSKQGA